MDSKKGAYLQPDESPREQCKGVQSVDVGESIPMVICPKFHFSVSPHIPFLNLLFEQIANSNEYLLDEIGVDKAESEPLGVWGKIQLNIHSPP